MVVILLSSILMGVLITGWMEEESLTAIHNELATQAITVRVITEDLPGLVGRGLQKRVRELGNATGSRFTLIDSSGVVIADSLENPAFMDNHGTRPEILSALSHGVGSSTRYSETLKTKMMYVAVPYLQNEEIAGYVRTSISLGKIDRKLARLQNIVLFGTGIAVVAALLVGYLLALNFSRPIESMTRRAESMSLGNYDEKLPVKREDEIGQLAKALNRMADGLRERIETISDEKKKLQAILAGMVEGVIAVSDDERIVHINGAASKIAGIPISGSIGRRFWEVSDLQVLSEVLGQTLRRRTEVERNVKVVGRDGDMYLNVHSAPIMSSENELAGAVMVLHDITELNNMERIRRDFVTNVSHELKTPVTAIRAMIETIIDDKEMSREDEARFLEKIKNQSIRLSALVGDVLTLARIESDKGEIESTRLNLRDLVFSVAESFQSDGDVNRVALESDIKEGDVLMAGDEETISQAVSNLIDNALKYTPHSGKVTVRLRADKENAVIMVEDDGPGIEPVHQRRIFERFYRIDKPRSRELGGTGLGLSIVKHAAITHGGTVEVKSEMGRGSVFTITLPLLM